MHRVLVVLLFVACADDPATRVDATTTTDATAPDTTEPTEVEPTTAAETEVAPDVEVVAPMTATFDPIDGSAFGPATIVKLLFDRPLAPGETIVVTGSLAGLADVERLDASASLVPKTAWPVGPANVSVTIGSAIFSASYTVLSADLFVDRAVATSGVGSSAAPFKTIGEALVAAAQVSPAHATITITPGVYRERLAISSGHLTISGAAQLEAPDAGGPAVTIDGDTQVAIDGLDVDGGVLVQNGADLVLRDLALQGDVALDAVDAGELDVQAVAFDGVTNIRVRDAERLVVADLPDFVFMRTGIDALNVGDIRVERVTFATRGAPGDRITPVKMLSPTSVRVSGCTLVALNADGDMLTAISVFGGDVTVIDNVIDLADCDPSDTVGIHATGTRSLVANNRLTHLRGKRAALGIETFGPAVILGNLVNGVDATESPNGETSGIDAHGLGVTIANNLVQTSISSGGGHELVVDGADAQVLNNGVLGNGLRATLVAGATIGMVANNVWSNGSAPLIVVGDAQLRIGDTLPYGDGQSAKLGALGNSLVGILPWSYPDLVPTADMPCDVREGGRDLASLGVTYDLSGNDRTATLTCSPARPGAAGWSIGPFEVD